MVTQAYMLEQRRPPSGAKRFLDQTLIPHAIDAAGAVEVSLQRLSDRTGVRSSTWLLMAVGSAAVAGLVLLAGPRRAR